MRTGEKTGTEPAGLTIEEVADAVGMTVRNVRAHQSRRLIPPPQRVGRVAYYSDTHVRLLRRVADLQRRGFNLAAIKALLLAEHGGQAAEPLRRLTFAPLMQADPIRVPADEFERTFATGVESERFLLAVKLGLLRPSGDYYELPSRTVVELYRTLQDAGFDISELFDLQAAVTEQTRDIAWKFVRLCLRDAWQPFADEGHPAERWPQVRDRFASLRDAAARILLATFAVHVHEAAEDLLDSEAPSDPAGPVSADLDEQLDLDG